MGSPSQNFMPAGDFFEQTLDEAFPEIDPGHEPLGSKVIVQVRIAKERTKNGIILPDEARETIQANTQVAKVVAIGPLAFQSKDGKPWPEGRWFEVGDYVRCPKYGGDRWEVPLKDGTGVVLFYLFDHLQFSAKVRNPTEVIAYV